MAKLEKWSVISDDSNPFMAPELRVNRLRGQIFEDDRFSDGDWVTTSSVKKIDIDGRVARTRNTEYRLGEPSHEYKEFLEEERELNE